MVGRTASHEQSAAAAAVTTADATAVVAVVLLVAATNDYTSSPAGVCLKGGATIDGVCNLDQYMIYSFIRTRM